MAKGSILAAPLVVALAGWILPGAGYALIGQVARGVTVGFCILGLFVMGILIAGIRVIDVPGYDQGFETRLRTAALVRGRDQGVGQKIDWWDRDFYSGQWALTARPLGEIINKPWYVGQVLTGPVSLLASKFSLYAARPVDVNAARTDPTARVARVQPSHARLAEIGSLYTAVAGMLNLLAIIDAASRAGRLSSD